jgi:murein DD-endopeptidase MepM/ murein hydrolase activator NlpD
MAKLLKYLKKKCKNGFTFLIVPNSSGGKVKSIAIPFSLALVIVSIIVFNTYVFFRYTTQIGDIYRLNHTLKTKEHENAKLKSEQKEVNPTLKRSYKMADELSILKKERTQLLTIWRSIQKKTGRQFSQTSRGSMIRVSPYIMPPSLNDGQLHTSLTQLKSNLTQLKGFIKEESKSQHELLLELQEYEHRLDHTPSIWPVRSLITSLFGFRRHPTLGYYKDHTGVDLQARYGTKVMAAADGTVSYAGYRGGYGYAVIIDHGYGYQTLYGHNSKLLVSVGQTIKKGQTISLSGNSGTSSGPHLHYEVRVNNNPVNPTAYLLRN